MVKEAQFSLVAFLYYLFSENNIYLRESDKNE